MKKLVVFSVLAIVVSAAILRIRHAPSADATANRLLADRIWIDHVPTGEKDTIDAFVALSPHSIGVFQKTSQWRGGFEAFRYEANGAELRIVYPQTGDRETVRAKARKCSERAMDFCLELEGASRGVKRYYSREGWEIRATDDLAEVARRVDALRAQL